MPSCAPSAAATAVAASRSRVMRWTFTRADEMVVCELGLNRDETGYELRLDPPWTPVPVKTELFDDVMSAFQRQTEVEKLLVGAGWSLEGFEMNRLP